MHSPQRSVRRRGVLAASVAYVAIGAIAASLAGAAASRTGTTAWRLAAWVLSLAVFLSHVAVSRRQPGSLRESASDAALAVAIAAFVLAVVGPVRGYWGEPRFARVALSSVVLWPLLTGVVAFGAALVTGRIVDRIASRPGDSSARGG